MMMSFIMTILGVQVGPKQDGKPFDKIFSMLNNVYMPGRGLTQDHLKEVLDQLILNNKISL